MMFGGIASREFLTIDEFEAYMERPLQEAIVTSTSNSRYEGPENSYGPVRSRVEGRPMKYLILIPLVLLFIYLMSFAKYQWQNKNRLAAVGIVVVALAAAALPIYLFFFSEFEI